MTGKTQNAVARCLEGLKNNMKKGQKKSKFLSHLLHCRLTDIVTRNKMAIDQCRASHE
jgi:hypothetical protein